MADLSNAISADCSHEILQELTMAVDDSYISLRLSREHLNG